jgi:hypothetical protein
MQRIGVRPSRARKELLRDRRFLALLQGRDAPDDDVEIDSRVRRARSKVPAQPGDVEIEQGFARQDAGARARCS